MGSPILDPLELTDDERSTLQRWARRPKSAQALAMRCRIVLRWADGGSNTAVAEALGLDRKTVTKWRGRFLADRLGGLHDEPRPGAPRTSPVLPLRPGRPERRTHDDLRHGTTNLYAALDVASGNVLAELTERHRAQEFGAS
jgi:DNA-binding CsgD family transcriptional regulator